ncbi:UDP-2,3-diacylglucosamine diphosphatase [uncultured Aquimonas sp.]|uniref:UDP-2,3-diacylglucosamine diphosphatase n=1 Tax=uncultured Aquimonas sp. TaxID=385483 RepID=UPI00086CED69|nr:UDP-2,3-diacylglucosamine diphosphatase [uncultured Aquimonas sp.]ODU48389.1 MAG: UDP-2,3-diacylglucosamine diphosphatase [Xanthomonadaceae bacterium SCN 69-123]
MSQFFISDLHLDTARPQITELFLRFLRDEAQQAESLYILGDLFEAWIGDDAPGALGNEVAHSLSACARAGTRLGFIRGNRDFLMGPAYARRCGIQLLPDPCVLKLGDHPTLLLHGDLLCTADIAYQRFRAQSRSPDWQAVFLARPLADREAFAAQARGESQRYQQSLQSELTDAQPEAVDAMLRLYGVGRMIHGHTHRPAVHALPSGARRYVLGDWYDHGSVLRITGSDWQLSRL